MGKKRAKSIKKTAISYYVSFFVGGKVKVSSRFQTYSLALKRLLALEKHYGSQFGGTIEVSPSIPDIFLHCGTITSVLDCLCPTCGKLLTKQDAYEVADKL